MLLGLWANQSLTFWTDWHISMNKSTFDLKIKCASALILGPWLGAVPQFLTCLDPDYKNLFCLVDLIVAP